MNISISELSLVLLVGPSGSGKSSFARTHFLPTEAVSSDFCRALVADNENDQSATGDAFDLLHEIVRKRLHAVEHYTQAYRQYCWPVSSLADLKLAPFHVLASEGSVHTDKPHTWHMEVIGKLCAADTEILLSTPFKIVDLQDAVSTTDAVTWWTDMTAQGQEGMVVKPLNFIAEGRCGITQPAMKRRGAEYLRIIYGPEYLLPANLERLRSRMSVQNAPWQAASSRLESKHWSDLFARDPCASRTNVSSVFSHLKVNP